MFDNTINAARAAIKFNDPSLLVLSKAALIRDLREFDRRDPNDVCDDADFWTLQGLFDVIEDRLIEMED